MPDFLLSESSRRRPWPYREPAPKSTAPARYCVAMSGAIHALNTTKRKKLAMPYMVNGLMSQFTDPCDDEALRILPDFPDAFKVDFHHHGINHDPDEDGDRYGNPCNRHISKKGRHGRCGFTKKHAGGHAEKYPDRQVTVEEADAFLFFLAHFTASFPSSWQGFPAPLSLAGLAGFVIRIGFFADGVPLYQCAQRPAAFQRQRIIHPLPALAGIDKACIARIFM